MNLQIFGHLLDAGGINYIVMLILVT